MGIMLWIFVVLLLNMYESHEVIQLNGVTNASAGVTVTLDCFFPVAFEHEPLNWYRQELGQKPHLMVKVLRDTMAWNTPFLNDSQSGRITIESSKGTFNLTIRNITSSDVATYYCGASMYGDIKFGNGTFLALTGQYNCSFNDDSAFFHAVANCGQIHCRNRTNLNSEKTIDPVVYGMAVALGLSVVLIFYLLFLHCKEHSAGDGKNFSTQMHMDDWFTTAVIYNIKTFKQQRK
ncbi:uncharacterized protein LOC143126285 isoform X2 [Alosa pseudoharengus]|uniref:uncharacterized protein LOC143126285 isoform X2 n=1 Tax=Alosa pseudoharengus TaxID=34774 RepID=UPI003F88D947